MTELNAYLDIVHNGGTRIMVYAFAEETQWV